MDRLARSNAQHVLQETYSFALLQAVRETAQGGRRPPVTLLGLGDIGALLPAPAPGTILLVGDGSGNAAARVAGLADALHAAGVQLAAPPEALAEAETDYALLDGARLGSAEVPKRCRHSAPAPGGWIATNLASFEEETEAVRYRVQLACGRFAGAREQRDRAMAPPAAMNIASILTALVNGRAPRELAAMFKGDVTLSFRLMRYTSMVGVSQGRAPESIQDAVLLPGTRDLHRGLCVLLADSGTSAVSRALPETALTRGRLLELLATRRGEPQPEHLFMLGAFSLLNLLLDVPLQTALSLAPVPQAVADALLEQRGAWRPYLDVALALEAGDPDSLDAACNALALARDDVVALHASASNWSTIAASFAQQA
jgi:EAL and modified HD-GYP domain-containing signal transduction protein